MFRKVRQIYLILLMLSWFGCGGSPDASLAKSSVDASQNKTNNPGVKKKNVPQKTTRPNNASQSNSTQATPARVIEPNIVEQQGHSRRILDVAFSHDSRFLASISEDLKLKVLDVESGILLRTSQNCIASVLAFIPGELKVITGWHTHLAIWDITTGKVLLEKRMPKNTKRLQALVVLPSGRHALTVDSGNPIRMWDLETGALVRLFGTAEPQDSRLARPLAVSAAGDTIASGHLDGTVKLWDVKTGALKGSYSIHEEAVTSIVFVNDDKIISGAGESPPRTIPTKNNLVLWRSSNGRVVRSFNVSDAVLDMDVLKGGATAAVAVSDFSKPLGGWPIQHFDLKTGKKIKQYVLPDTIFYRMAISSNGTYQAAAGVYDEIVIWKGIDKAPALGNGDITSNYRYIEPSRGTRDVATLANTWWVGTSSINGIDFTIWDLEKMKAHRLFRKKGKSLYQPGHTNRYAITFFPDGKHIMLHDAIWDIEKGVFVRKLTVNNRTPTIAEVLVSDDGEKIVITTADSNYKNLRISVWNVTEQKLLSREHSNSIEPLYSFSAPPLTDNIWRVDISGDGRYLIAASNPTVLFDLNKGRIIKEYSFDAMFAQFISDGHTAFIINKKKEAFIWDIDQHHMVNGLWGLNFSGVKVAAISADGSRLAVGRGYDGDGDRETNEISVWDVATRQRKLIGTVPECGITDIKFLNGNNYLAVACYSQATVVLNLTTGKSVNLQRTDREWNIFRLGGYFAASRKGGNMLAGTDNMKGFPIGNLAIRYNRPDLLLEHIGLGSKAQRDHYHRQYKKRLNKLGIQESDFPTLFSKLPTLEIEKVEQKGRRAHINFLMASPHSPLVSYQVYANGVPVYGQKGKAVKPGAISARDTVILEDGKNIIELTSTNALGIESVRARHVVAYSDKEKHDLYLVGFGVSNYKDSSFNLKYAAKDALDIESAVKDMHRKFKQVFTQTYVNSNVTIDAFKKAKRFLKNTKVGDTVIVFIAGHGMYDNNSPGDYYFLTYNTNLRNLKSTAAHFNRIEGLLDGIAARKKLLLLDTCQSGELDVDDAFSEKKRARTLGLVSRGIRLKSQISSSQKTRHNYFDERDERYIYSDLFRSSGTIVISSSLGSEMSYERDDIQNGIFTEEILNAFHSKRADKNRDARISTEELRNYLIDTVSKGTNGLQHPVVDRDNLEIEFDFPVLNTAN